VTSEGLSPDTRAAIAVKFPERSSSVPATIDVLLDAAESGDWAS